LDKIRCASIHLALLRNSEKTELMQIHGKIFKAIFGSDVPRDMVGEGFSISETATLQFMSTVFNKPIGSAYHDGSRDTSEPTKLLLKHVVERWIAGWLYPGTTLMVEDILALRGCIRREL
jgi:hypothetical protein